MLTSQPWLSRARTQATCCLLTATCSVLQPPLFSALIFAPLDSSSCSTSGWFLHTQHRQPQQLDTPIYLYDLGVICRPKFSAYQNKTKIITISRHVLRLVFQSGIYPVLGFQWHIGKPRDLSLLKCWFLYCTSCSLGSEFSGNLKARLVFLLQSMSCSLLCGSPV